jgi:hypothetical protein
MGCDYYIYHVLKIVHRTGTEHIKLHTMPLYLVKGGDEAKNELLQLLPDSKELTTLYDKRTQTMSGAIPAQYSALIQENIRQNVEEGYASALLRNNSFLARFDSGEKMTHTDDITKICIAELREWRN